MKISIGSKIKDGPWGGGNLFLENLIQALKRDGHLVINHLNDEDIDIIFLFDPRKDSELATFNHIDIANYLFYVNSNTKVIHRINECDERKNTKGVNKYFINANKVADKTIFVSEWLQNLYLQQGFQSDDYEVILSGSNREVFNTFSKKNYQPNEKLNIVTHHWGNNWNKGFEIYTQLDKLLNEKEFNNINFTYIGNLPTNFSFNNSVHITPLSGKDLADELKKHHIYLTASLNEPSGNHHIEGALCGLPILYINSGGIPEYCRGFGVEFTKSTFVESLKYLQSNILKYESKMHDYPYDSELMNGKYLKSMTKLLNGNRTNFQYRDMKSNKIMFKLSNLMKL